MVIGRADLRVKVRKATKHGKYMHHLFVKKQNKFVNILLFVAF